MTLRTGALSVALLLAAASTGTAGEWEPLPTELLEIEDCPEEPGCPAAVLREETFLDNSHINARVEVHRIVKIFTPEGLDAASLALPFVPRTWNIRDLAGRTIRADGTQVELRPQEAVERTVIKGNGLRRKEVIVEMPAAEVGATLEYRYRKVYRYRVSGYGWSPQGRHPVLRSTLLISSGPYAWAPVALNMRGISKSMDVDPEGRPRIVFTNVPAIYEEPFMPPEEEVTARLALISKYQNWQWGDLGKEAHAYFDKYFKRSKDARRKTREVVGEAGDPEVVVEKLYRWVQNNVDNTAYSETEEGETETDDGNDTVDDVLSTMQGSHLDLIRLFTFMARESGLDAEVALVTTRDQAFFRKNLKDLFQFNSELAAVRLDGEWRFYDPGTRYCPLGMVGWENEGLWENALITRDNGGFIVQVPSSAAAENLERRVTHLEIAADGQGKALVEEEDHGLAGTNFRNDLDHLGDDDRRGWLESRMTAREGLTVLDLEVANLAAWSDPLQLRYRVQVDKLGTTAGTRLLLPATLVPLPNPFVAAERRNDVYFPRTRRTVDEIIVAIPDGYEVESVPEDRELDSGRLVYGLRFTPSDKEIKVSRELTVDLLLVDRAKYALLRKFFEEVEEADSAQIVLRRASDDAGGVDG